MACTPLSEVASLSAGANHADQFLFQTCVLADGEQCLSSSSRADVLPKQLSEQRRKLRWIPFLSFPTQVKPTGLTAVSFVDWDGITLLRELKARDVAITNCSPFIAHQLNNCEPRRNSRHGL
jgi:hypothetical protein